MRRRWSDLSEEDQTALKAMIAFLEGRLEDRKTVDWSLHLKPNDFVQRMAMLHLIDSSSGKKTGEPWQTAWRLIEESWKESAVQDNTRTGEYDAQRRLRTGERSGSLVAAIVGLVDPKLQIEPFSKLYSSYRKRRIRPKAFNDLFSASLTSGKTIDPKKLELEIITDSSFLSALALAADASVLNGLEIARRIGWNENQGSWLLGTLNRVYYVTPADRDDGEHEPDKFHRGIAPSTKLLHTVVSRLVDIDISKAIQFVHHWKIADSPVHIRLWAALSRDPRVMPAKEVVEVLSSMDSVRFWDINKFPEIAELRVKRFSEFERQDQAMLLTRIRKLPPRNQWPKDVPADQIRTRRVYSALRELKRIELTGVSLPKPYKKWLDTNILEFPKLIQMNRLDEGFPNTIRAHFIHPNPDSRYDLLAGEERLQSLEFSFSSSRGGWHDDPAERAADWIRLLENPVKIIADFESTSDKGNTFTTVWERFGWSHTPSPTQRADDTQRNVMDECARVLSLLNDLSNNTLHQAINGISEWMSAWTKQLVLFPNWSKVWLKIWPIAVESTNKLPPVEDEVQRITVKPSADELKPIDLDTLNSPVGKFVGVFLAACPDLEKNKNPFCVNNPLRLIRDSIITAKGQARLISLHRMIEELPYFLKADKEWAEKYLIEPLIDNDPEAIALWSAIARRTQFSEVLRLIGLQMVERVTDPQLDRESKKSLVFSLIIECLHALKDRREPVVSHDRIQQMIRSLDDEVRAYAAEAVQSFVHDVSRSHREGQKSWSPEELFKLAALPFLRLFWPQEKSLVTPGVSEALAKLPATTNEAFAECVMAIERFLVPFNCWSMYEYGLYGEINGESDLSIINDSQKAEYLLRLLDLTIGTAEGSVVPYDLHEALEQVRKILPILQESKTFRRLATAGRR